MMSYLNAGDYAIIAGYLVILLGLGFYLKKKASASIENYFLGGRTVPGWILGIGQMAGFLDVSGTLLIVSFLFILGPRGLFVEFRGGVVLVLAVMMLWTGKWHRRSQCITGAEWMIYRFGEGYGGQFARILAAIANIVGTVGMLAYLVKGAGLFFSMFLPFSPIVCAIILIAIATLFTVISGFYVVYAELFQTFLVLLAVIVVTVMAVIKMGSTDNFGAIAEQVTGSRSWMTSYPQWTTEMPSGYEAFKHLTLFAMFYLMRNVFTSMGGGDDPRYFGARSDRECGTLTFLSTSMLMIRWPLMMGFTVLGIFMVRDLFPDQTVLLQASDLIRQHLGNIEKSQWPAVLANILHHQSNYPELVSGLKEILGSEWTTKLHLVSFEGTVNPERILPAVILFNIPIGVRGLMVAAMMAAVLSTFETMVNRTTAFFTRDLYQRYMRPKASTKELVYSSWVFGVVLVIAGLLMGYYVDSINNVYGWYIMVLGGGLMVPFMIKFYWWRFNGGGFAIGVLGGMTAAIFNKPLWAFLQRFFDVGETNDWKGFVFTVVIGLICTIVGTLLSKPTNKEIVKKFYQETKPFGFWGPLKATLDPEVRKAMVKEHRNDVMALPFALGWQITLFLMPMQLIIRSYKPFWITFIIFAVCLIGLYFIWYKNLPPKPEKQQN